jgi:thiol-disulfide isomerase/thioredoxin
MASRMSKRTWLIRVILIIAIGALFGVVMSCDSPNPSETEAPNFTLPTMTGANVTLSELEGTPVVLNFWSISCTYCRQQLPYLENVANASGDMVKVIAVNIVDSAATVQTFFGDYEPVMIVALDNNGETFVTYCQDFSNPQGYIPFTLLVDSDGIVQYKKIGAFASETELRNTLHDVFGITIP